MKDPSSLLRAADPLREEPPDAALSQEDAQAIRRALMARMTTMAAIPAGADARPIWQRPFSLAAAAAVVVAASGIIGHRVMSGPEAEPDVPARAQVQPGGDGERRQLQFRTSGGTRIIWIFDDSLRLQEPMP
jgi:hypothetical protein